MANPNDVAVRVHQAAVRHTPHPEIFIGRANSIACPVVFHVSPSIFLNMVLESLLRLVDAHSNETHFRPFACLFVLFDHFLVVSHRFLARGTPSGPKIDHQRVSLPVGQGQGLVVAQAEGLGPQGLLDGLGQALTLSQPVGGADAREQGDQEIGRAHV